MLDLNAVKRIYEPDFDSHKEVEASDEISEAMLALALGLSQEPLRCLTPEDLVAFYEEMDRGENDEQMDRGLIARLRKLQQGSQPVVVEVTKRSANYFAIIAGTNTSGAGVNIDDAIGNLVRCNPEKFNIKLDRQGV